VNNEYRLLKDLWCNVMGTTIETTQFVGLDFSDPDVDMHKVAEGFGARVETIDDVQAVGDVLARALAHLGPSFLIINHEP
jgi:benzoylformate decarboxylase